MELLIRVAVGVTIGIVSGSIIEKLCLIYISETEDRVKEYKSNKIKVIIATVIFTVAILLKFNWIGFIHYGVVGLMLILIGIIDYHTHYVYKIMSIPMIVFSLFIGIYSYGANELIGQISFFIIIYLFAMVKGQFYGDIECLIVIGCVVGRLGLFIVMAIALTLLLLKLLLNRNNNIKSAALCPYLAFAYILTIVFIF